MRLVEAENTPDGRDGNVADSLEHSNNIKSFIGAKVLTMFEDTVWIVS